MPLNDKQKGLLDGYLETAREYDDEEQAHENALKALSLLKSVNLQLVEEVGTLSPVLRRDVLAQNRKIENMMKELSEGEYYITPEQVKDLEALAQSNEVLHKKFETERSSATSSGKKPVKTRKTPEEMLWNNISRQVINATKDSIEQNISAPFLLDVEHHNGEPYLVLRCDQSLRDSWEAQGLSDECKEYDKSYKAFQDLGAALPEGTLKVFPPNKGGIVKLEFHMTPEALNAFLMEKSHTYRGYRDANSLLMLENPNAAIQKEGVILLSSALVFPGSDLTYLRAAGCNTSALISIQITNLLLQYGPDSEMGIELGHRLMYGHTMSPYAQEELGINAGLILDALGKCLNLKEVPAFQAMDGLIRIPKELYGSCSLQPQTEETKAIYRKILPLQPSELEQAQSRSIEIKPNDYIDKLIEAMEENIEIIKEDKGEVSENQIKKLQNGIQILRKIKEKISDELGETNASTPKL